MTRYLNKPVIVKISNDEENDYINVGTSSMQGWRVSQEDAHNCILNFDENTSFFAVYDGHSGREVAKYCAENFPAFLKQLNVYKEGNYEQALKNAFLEFDGTLLQDDVLEILKQLSDKKYSDNDSDVAEDETPDDGARAKKIKVPGKNSGCTAVIALLNGRDLYVANVGDSRCVLCRSGQFIAMSEDHKPEDENEENRIKKAGGFIINGRINGRINLSRTIGDHAYKMNKDLPPEEQIISALPDIKKIVITPEDEFLILACDGIWNYMSSQEVVEFVKNKLNEGVEPLSKICEELLDFCLATGRCTQKIKAKGPGYDNMTAIIIKFKQPNILELPSKELSPCDVEIPENETQQTENV